MVSRSALGMQLATRYAGEAVGAGACEDETAAQYSCAAMSDEVVCLVISQCAPATLLAFCRLCGRASDAFRLPCAHKLPMPACPLTLLDLVPPEVRHKSDFKRVHFWLVN